MPEQPTHPCPGCHTPGVPQQKLACPMCWARLPQVLRDEVWATYKRRRVAPIEHLRAVCAARKWYRAHPPALKGALRRSQGAGWPVSGNRHASLYRSWGKTPEGDGK